MFLHKRLASFYKGGDLYSDCPQSVERGGCDMSLMEVISLIGLLISVAGAAYKLGYDNGQNSKKTKK